MKKKKQEATKKPLRAAKELSRETLTSAIRKSARRSGRRPRVSELKTETGYDVSTYVSVFGSWSAALKAAGFRPNDQRQTHPERYPSRDRLAELLRSCAKRLGRRPKMTDLEKETGYNIQPYLREFGRWRKALEYAGLLTYSTLSPGEQQAMRKKLEDAFRDLSRRLGHMASSGDLDRKGKYSYRYYVKFFGSYKGFLKTQNLKPVVTKLTRKQLDENYDMVKKQLGRLPRTTELNLYGKYTTQTYRERFGSVRNYRVLRGEDLIPTGEIPVKQIIADYKRIKKAIGRVPKVSELAERIDYSIDRLIVKRFGGYGKFLKKIGEDAARMEDWFSAAVSQYWMVKKKIGKVPSEEEYGKNGKFYNGTLRKHFGTWNNFLRFLGEPLHTGGRRPVKKRKQPAVDHLKHLRTSGYRK